MLTVSLFQKRLQKSQVENIKTSSNTCNLIPSSLPLVPTSDSETEKLKALKSGERGQTPQEVLQMGSVCHMRFKYNGDV